MTEGRKKIVRMHNVHPGDKVEPVDNAKKKGVVMKEVTEPPVEPKVKAPKKKKKETKE